MSKPVGKIKVNVYLTKIQYNQLCRYMEFCECYSTPAEMATRLVQVGLSEAIKRGAIEED
ncbi:hypothetical protein [Enterocloster bolteae]|uniref:Uncharacterized protein n=1 Tax=Enterocloster bolteae 90B8 TaxID=997897 RepID=R0AKF2_9FIRM|nr:hypothetical protein [Enterocloster bolteae]ENZ33219.1 hypothetical protein HMPREF1097_05001 [Enterocloster bolteae 90B8]